ncbi:MAG: response regulator transcription factor [Nitrospiraceae bacterium]|nr:response regulator transcription factor [Nitrospiraceae bacterium]
MSRILVIDDDRELCELLSDYLRPEGFEVEAVFDGEQGVARAISGDHGLVVLDVMLPGISGFEALRRIRDRSKIPVIMLTARGDDVDRIVGLEMGADDYLPKPFNPRELVARVRAIQRRAEPASAQERGEASGRLVVADVQLDTMARTVTRSGVPVELTAIEFSLLGELLRAAGKVVTRADLSRKVLGRGLSPYDRSIDVHVSSLRKKLGHEVEGLERIRTVRGIGYVYACAGSPGRDEGD